MDEAVKKDIIVCVSNAYTQKYYLDRAFEKMPKQVKDELKIMCVLFTEEVGGIFTIEFDEEGKVNLRTEASEEDYLYDEIGSGLLVGTIRRKRQELFESLSLYYKAAFLHEDISGLLEDE